MPRDRPRPLSARKLLAQRRLCVPDPELDAELGEAVSEARGEPESEVRGEALSEATGEVASELPGDAPFEPTRS